MAVAGLLALVVATLLGIGLSRRLARPVHRLEEAALAMAGGDLQQQVPVETPDELGELAIAFNVMAREVRESFAQQRAFVANASHELRTPLTNIKLRSEALLGGAANDIRVRAATWPKSTVRPTGWAGWPARCWTCPGWTRLAQPSSLGGAR